MTDAKFTTLCLLGCVTPPGNLGGAILDSLLNGKQSDALFTQFIACVRSQATEEKLAARFPEHLSKLSIKRGDNARAVRDADVVILGVDPADIESVLTQHGLREALENKLIISIAAGWTRQKLEETIYGSATTNANKANRAWVVRTLPNIAAQVSQSLTAIEVSEPAPPEHYLQITTAIFEQIGKAVQIDPKLMNATTAVGGSTPAMFAVICDAMIDAAVAVGVPRELAHTMIFQSMQGTAAMLQSGMHPALLKDQGTSPEGCTIGGLMVMEEAGVRGSVGRALREAVTLARLMETQEHVNDTRR
ncbi:hypothetical protein N7532_002807 [Penicillium argentinense]|uniref:Pyrroline-5-carboxylate reductase n=1 Tax=Penicillium argentinense TaxID=1131581 RepID=A0A9W9KLU8_9EURO|nr:uncharacterized protein N7532_002807 [Penicillium argentinense]KAJ5110162.1 hypothetical protein N7532_002807 [Penicillium argentinense]